MDFIQQQVGVGWGGYTGSSSATGKGSADSEPAGGI